MISRSESKKRNNGILQESKQESSSKFWNGSDSEDGDQGLADPRNDEDWKIQKRKGFQKDRDEKIKSNKQLKQSKTSSLH